MNINYVLELENLNQVFNSANVDDVIDNFVDIFMNNYNHW